MRLKASPDEPVALTLAGVRGLGDEEALEAGRRRVVPRVGAARRVRVGVDIVCCANAFRCDARDHGVEALPVDVNSSNWDCTLEREVGEPASAGGEPAEEANPLSALPNLPGASTENESEPAAAAGVDLAGDEVRHDVLHSAAAATSTSIPAGEG